MPQFTRDELYDLVWTVPGHCAGKAIRHLGRRSRQDLCTARNPAAAAGLLGREGSLTDYHKTPQKGVLSWYPSRNMISARSRRRDP